MIASKPVRVVSLAIVALVVLVGVRGIIGAGSSRDLFGGARGSEHAGRGEQTPAVLERVVDGDTVRVRTQDGQRVRVRLLGINAPEVAHAGSSGECFGRRSTKNLQRLLRVGSELTLVSDPSQDDVDAYGRWLRYVEAAGRDVGRAQIRSGSATSASDGAAPVSRAAAYEQVEDEARIRGAGLWGPCR